MDYLLFKQAAGTGWDCPRAQVLVMFREISSDTFHTQVVGRILRVPVRGVQGSSVFRTGYLYTNYRRNEVRVPNQNGANKPRTLVAANRLGSFAIDPLLRRDFTPRTDYGDLGSAPAFQRCLVEEFNRFFGLTADMPLDRRTQQLAAMGLQLSPPLTSEIMVDARIGDIDRIEAEMARSGADTAYRMSRNDVEKTFTALCATLLREQTEEATRVSNVARSWSPLKSALRVWLKQALSVVEDRFYRIFVYDVTRGDETSLFRRALVQTLRAYRPLLDAQRQQACERAAGRESEPFRLLDCYAYTEDYEAQEMRRCLLRPFYIRKKYPGRDTELPFARYLDGLGAVDWWMKNGDSGKDFFAIRYHDTAKGRDELFYPDWMVRFEDGRIGLFDTKGGQTAASAETRDKARALYRRIAWLNAHSTVRYVGGIVVKGNGQWYLNDAEDYRYREGHLEGWKEFVEIVGQQV